MNILFRLIILGVPLLGFSSSYAGDCSVHISNNSGPVIVYGSIETKCTGEASDEVKDLQSKVENYNTNIKAINDLLGDIKSINTALKSKFNKNDSKLTFHDEQLFRLREEQNILEVKYQKVLSDQGQLKEAVLQSYRDLKMVVDKSSQAAIDMNLKLEREIENASTSLNQKIEIGFVQNDVRFQMLEQRVDKLENDNTVLMEAWRAGNLQDGVGYISASTGSWYTKQFWVPKAAIEYERLIPNSENDFIKNVSFFGEIEWLKWTESQKFGTFPGMPMSEFSSDHSIVNFSMGTRIFQKVGEQYQFYELFSGGHSIAGTENTFSYAIGLGIEYTRKSTRASFEIRWENFSKIEQALVTFNAFGNSRIDKIYGNQGGFLISARVAFR